MAESYPITITAVSKTPPKSLTDLSHGCDPARHENDRRRKPTETSYAISAPAMNIKVDEAPACGYHPRQRYRRLSL